jgi:hypothetical protein
MTELLITNLKAAAGTRTDTDGLLMADAADQLERQRAQITSLLRALELLSEDVLRTVEEMKKLNEQTFAAIVRHLGPPPPGAQS